MNFACIHDCSICPFYGRDVSSKVYQNIENSILPNGLMKSTPEETKSDLVIEQSEIKEEETTLPVLSEVQFSVETIQPEKKKLFSWRKK